MSYIIREYNIASIMCILYKFYMKTLGCDILTENSIPFNFSTVRSPSPFSDGTI
jgi:hypothetical protein